MRQKALRPRHPLLFYGRFYDILQKITTPFKHDPGINSMPFDAHERHVAGRVWTHLQHQTAL